MIRINDFNKILDEVKNKHSEYDELTLRLHLLGYSVWEHIYKTKLKWSLVKEIERAFGGLLKFDLIVNLLKYDPFDLKHCTDCEFEDLKRFVAFQVAEFRRCSRTRKTKFDSHFDLLHDLSSHDPDAIRLEVDDSFGESFRVNFTKLTDQSYSQLIEFWIDDFFLRSNHHPTDELISLIVDQLIIDGIDTIFSLNSGIGSIPLEIACRFPGKIFSVEADTRSLCERFLCDVNLWTVADKLGEPLVSEGDRFEEVQRNYVFSHYHKILDNDRFDCAVGIVPATDVVTNKDLDPIFYKFSSRTQNYENAYVELMLSVVNDTR